MNYDLMVFEKTAAPRNLNEFMKCYDAQTEWNEDHKKISSNEWSLCSLRERI
jgi:hypothetical protein